MDCGNESSNKDKDKDMNMDTTRMVYTVEYLAADCQYVVLWMLTTASFHVCSLLLIFHS